MQTFVFFIFNNNRLVHITIHIIILISSRFTTSNKYLLNGPESRPLCHPQMIIVLVQCC